MSSSSKMLTVGVAAAGLAATLRSGASFVVGSPAAQHQIASSASLRGASAASASPSSAGASSAAAVGVAAAALAAVGGSAAARRRPAQKKRGDVVVTRDGSSWGVTGSGASSSVDTSGPIPFVKLTRGKDEATVYLLGGTVTSYKTDGTEWIAVRPDAKLDGSKPISGGLPFCFPQFGPGDIQQHGFARNMEWKLMEEPSEAGVCVLELSDSEATREMWPHNFLMEYRVELLEGKLSTSLKVLNTSKSAFNFQCALHSYYSVSNVDTCKITGDFKDAARIDKTEDNPKMSKGASDTIEISKFTEEIYKEVLPGTVTISDPAKGDLQLVNTGGWKDVVIWNPYGDKNMGASGFVCVESAELALIPLDGNECWQAGLDLVPKPKA